MCIYLATVESNRYHTHLAGLAEEALSDGRRRRHFFYGGQYVVWSVYGVVLVGREWQMEDDQDKIWRRFDPRYVNLDAEEKDAMLRSRNKEEEGRKKKNEE